MKRAGKLLAAAGCAALAVGRAGAADFDFAAPARPLTELDPNIVLVQEPPAAPGQAPSPSAAQLAAAAAAAERRTREDLPQRASPQMLGDLLGLPAIAFSPRGLFRPVPGQGPAGAVFAPQIRAFKIADDQSPAPQDRVYFDFNYWNNANKALNEAFGADIRNIHVFREAVGIEKTFLDQSASIGLRLPVNTVSSESGVPGLGGTDSSVGDLTAILKYAPWRNTETGSLVSVGLAVTVPTGPDDFAGFHQVINFHSTTLQPFVGWIWRSGDFIAHGFTSIDVPTDSSDVTILFNDIGIGYTVFRSDDPSRLLTAVTPMFEVHINTPLNHRGGLSLTDLAGTADVLDLTGGVRLDLGSRAALNIGLAAPVTGPKPFDFEAIVQLNVSFGGPRHCANDPCR
jgi:hypothetical protein